jgi:hypothetical protein
LPTIQASPRHGQSRLAADHSGSQFVALWRPQGANPNHISATAVTPAGRS